MKNLYLLPLCFLAFLSPKFTFSQIDSTAAASAITFSGYAEMYYGYDLGQPENHERPGFTYNHRRHNELNFNLIMGKMAYQKNGIRANIGLMAGNYAQNNLATEPTWAQNIFEANAGFKISKNRNVWLDAGIFPSHIGFESAIGGDCWTLSRSIVAENSPYFESGIRLSATNRKENLTTSVFYLNGWQRIRKPDGIQKPSFGVQFLYKPKASLTLNYSNFLGTDRPDSLDAVRIYHNFYAIFEPSAKWGLTAGLDLGSEKNLAGVFENWLAPVLIVRFSIREDSKM